MIIDTKTAGRSKKRSYIQTHLIYNQAKSWFAGYNDEFHWLDVCCGRGEALNEFVNLYNDDRNRIRYYAYDINHDFVSDVANLGRTLGITTHVETGGLENLKTILSKKYPNQKFTCLSVVNVVHELPLALVPSLLIDLIQLCNESGFVFFFDIMRIPYNDPEYGAIPWETDQVEPLLDLLAKFFKLRRSIQVIPYGAMEGSPHSAWYFDFKPGVIAESNRQLLHNENARETLSLELAKALFDAFEKRLDKLNYDIFLHSEELTPSGKDHAALHRSRFQDSVGFLSQKGSRPCGNSFACRTA